MAATTLQGERRFAVIEADWGPTMVPRLTVDEYYELMDRIGMGGQNQWELIDGYIRLIDRSASGQSRNTMSPQHAYAVESLAELKPQFKARGCFLKVQTDVRLGDGSAPIPDASVVVGTLRDYQHQHPDPSETLCVIEVADSSLGFDLGEKLRRYAAAGERMYVVLNVRERSAIVFTQPSGEGYATRRDLAADDTLALPTADGPLVEVRVGDLLPRAS